MFISMPLPSQVARPPMNHTPRPMHSTPPIFESCTGLLSTPDFSTFQPISVIAFINPPGYTPFIQPSTLHPIYFSRPSLQLSGPSFPMISMQSSGHSFPIPYMQPNGPSFPMSSMQLSMQSLRQILE